MTSLHMRRVGSGPVRRLLLVLLLTLACWPGAIVLQGQQAPPANQLPGQQPPTVETGMTVERAIHEMRTAVFRLPLAAILGTILALRPKRKGTPTRTPAVVQTQIMLAVVGAVVMLVVGASLARAFGIVGAANLIRYRSKIDDPKDAVVMLCALAIGLACGVGAYILAVFATLFIGAALWIIESFEPEKQKAFELTVKAGEHSDDLRDKVEALLRRYRVDFEMRTLSEEALSYHVKVPFDVQTDQLSSALDRLAPDRTITVDWAEKKGKDK